MKKNSGPLPVSELWQERHPCLSAKAHQRYGRMHLPVAPVCNIQCRFCSRGICKTGQRPGTAQQLLTPEQAAETVEQALKLCPQLTVIGVAGPGDALASPHALETFRLLQRRYPHLIFCLSTNGLLLWEKAAALAEAGVKSVTVTMNAVDERILPQICSSVLYNGQRLTENWGARRLIYSQIAGIRRAVRLGMSVKVNAVLVPGVNDKHIGEIAKVAAQSGASFFNVIPLLPQNEFKDWREPTCEEIEAARAASEVHLPVFRHCRRCRADACGIPGSEDFADQLYTSRVETFSHG